MVAIIIRGINDPQVRAATTNAKLMPNEIVEFLSIYTKPTVTSSNRNPNTSRNNNFTKPNYDFNNSRKRNPYDKKCFKFTVPINRNRFR